ncbi:MAG: general secretion pathway protein GspB, partial [Chitinophagaceae bacterium]|nr:general secretion pathway protein GspB [Polaromonas sp.]
ALKKADSERERTVVPNLHAQPVTFNRHSDQPLTRQLMWPWLLASGALLMVGGAWWAAKPVEKPAEKPVEKLAALPTVIPAPNPVLPSAEVVAQPTLQTAQVAAVAPVARISGKPPVVSTTMALPQAALAKPPQKLPVANLPSAKISNPAASLAPSAAPVPEPKTETAAVMFQDLPVDTRQALPTLVISGSTYSSNPAYRMLIINGQVLREGDAVASDLLLARIKPRSAVFNFKGLLYSVGY